MNSGFRLVDRDYLILSEIDRWRVILGRHICNMTDFTGQRACDRRLQKLLTAGFIKREKILYGVPYIYTLTLTGKALIGVSASNKHIRIEQITHDILVADTAVFFNQKYDLPYSEIVTEKQLHRQDGFSNRKHQPDFVFKHNAKTYCVEIELTLKSKDRFKKNIIDNFNNYDYQIWIVPDLHTKIYTFLSEMSMNYPNIKIIEAKEIKSYEP